MTLEAKISTNFPKWTDFNYAPPWDLCVLFSATFLQEKSPEKCAFGCTLEAQSTNNKCFSWGVSFRVVAIPTKPLHCRIPYQSCEGVAAGGLVSIYSLSSS